MGVLLLFVSAFGADDPKARDARGNTPLHTAAFRNDAEAVEDLLARGADANATNHARATPLHYGTGSERIVRALLQAGAGVDAVSAAGLTPLLTAVARDRSVEVARQLLESGANANASVPRSDGPYRALTLAILGGDSRTAELLLQYGASVNVPAGRSPLAAAAYVGDAALTQLLLDQIAHINYDSGFAGSALNFAFYSGHPQVASLLIDFGADLTFPSAVGYATPPLLWAAYNETGEAGFARLLLRRRIDLNTINEAGETALSYALKRGPDTPLVRFLREAGAKPPARPAGSKTPPNRIVPAAGPARAALARESAQKAVTLLQRSSQAFLENGFVRDQAKCISCHQQTLPAVAFGLAHERGLAVDELALARQLVAQVGMLAPRVEPARQMDEPFRGPFVSLGYMADGLAALGYRADEMTTAMSDYLIGVQRAAGYWGAFDRRPPLEDGPIVGTAWAVRALQLYPPKGRERAGREALDRARAWLEQQKPQTHNEQVFQLLGLVWSGEPRPALRPFRDALLATQGADGGWTQLPGLAADAWATGSALVALQKAKLGVWEPAYQRGVEFLLRTQFDDGSWWVRSRAWPFQTHFDSQFPHGRDQWISAAGTAWATTAILLTLPIQRRVASLPDAQELVARFVPPPAARPRAEIPAPGNAATAGVSFARDIQPLVERSCLPCHDEKKPRGDFSLASRERLLQGGSSGDPAVVPGRSAASHLLRYVSDQIEDLEMPPLRRRDEYPPLSPAEIARLRTWIEAGATWN